ncbi:hypothetical protein FDECE_4961 [Fusarium decemcellulare]|nr:hypothetical protein FDECE_4961 [Fusarium decemcellulare]
MESDLKHNDAVAADGKQQTFVGMATRIAGEHEDAEFLQRSDTERSHDLGAIDEATGAVLCQVGVNARARLAVQTRIVILAPLLPRW